MDLQKVTESLKENVPALIKDNKGALIGALAGYLLTNSEEAKTAILGAVAGSLLIDQKPKSNTEESK